jgi:hypothetical protein
VCGRVCGLPLCFSNWLCGIWLLAAPMSAAGWCWVSQHRGQHAQHARHECVQQECRLGVARRRSGSGSAVAVAVAVAVIGSRGGGVARRMMPVLMSCLEVVVRVAADVLATWLHVPSTCTVYGPAVPAVQGHRG